MSDPGRRFIASLLACILFGYAAVSCLVFYRRMRRRISEFKEPADGQRYLERVVHSPPYGLTLWLTGAIGVIGFTVASWELLLSLLAIVHGN